MVGGEDGGKGDGAAAGLVSMMEGVGRTVTASCTFESVPVVAVRRDCGGSLRCTIRDREPELRREVGGEEASMSITSNAGKEVFVKSQSRRVSLRDSDLPSVRKPDPEVCTWVRAGHHRSLCVCQFWCSPTIQSLVRNTVDIFDSNEAKVVLRPTLQTSTSILNFLY